MSFNIIITFHSSDVNIAYYLVDIFKKSSLDQIYLVDEQKPVNIETRYEYLNKSSVLIVLCSRKYLHEGFCMELINFGRDLNKDIFSINTSTFFRPYGALGAIIAGSGRQLIEIENEETKKIQLNKLIFDLKQIEQLSKNLNEPIRPKSTQPQVDLKFNNQKLDILVSYHPKQELNARLLENGLANSQFTFKLEDSTCQSTSVKCCRTLIIVMSDDYENSGVSKSVVDLARSLKKNIIPVAIRKGWKSNRWLGLVIAGKLFFRVISQEQVLQKNSQYEFTPMDEIMLEVAKSVQIRPAESDREVAFRKAVEKKCEECRQKLLKWPPTRRSRPKKELKPVKVLLKKTQVAPNQFFPTQHFTVGRAFVLPNTLYDNFGVPKRIRFDAMISYQWSSQQLVKKIFMNLYMKNLSIWFDVWGYMQGCTYDAMATAIECSKVIVVFLSNKYQSSKNCQLEFKYAIARGKPFIFVIVEDNVILEPWLKPFFDQSPKFEIKHEKDQDILEDGAPRLHYISQAIRDIGFAQMELEDECWDFSEETCRLKETLDDALDDLDEQNGTSRFKQCTRCHKKFDTENNHNLQCFKHRDYYLNFWICCGQLDIDSVGCVSVDHTHLKREWKEDKNYGTFNWDPD